MAAAAAVAERVERDGGARTVRDESLVEPRFEVIGGEVYAMSAPGFLHQRAVLGIGTQLDTRLAAHGCAVVIAPFDVYPLADQGDELTLVQPDVFIACDRGRLRGDRYRGAPRFIVEVLSSNRSHDMLLKVNLYRRAGVEEYWIVDAEARVVITLTLTNGEYVTRMYPADREVPLASVPGCAVDFGRVFETPWGEGE